ncbi:MAG: DUF4058 domain-containing protein, partial [Fimbriiglobus sp.]
GPSVEIDVATFRGDERPPLEPFRPDRGEWTIAEPWLGYTPPAAAATVPTVFAADFEIKVIGDRSGRHLVAALELVSPANKDSPASRRAFAGKCANYLYHGAGVLIVDVVTSRSADLHRETLALIGHPDAAPLPDRSPHLYATAYRPIRRGDRTEVDVWAEPVAVGSLLPTLPLWLNAVEAIPVGLEAAYTDACRRRRISA